MKFRYYVDGDIYRMMEQEIDAAEVGVTRGIRAASEGLKAEWRGQIIAAGLGQRLANTVRAATYPSRLNSISAASLAYSRAPEVVDAHDRGALIRSEKGLWLAIPLGEVAKMRGRKVEGGRASSRITPRGWELRTGMALRFVYRPGKFPLLVTDGRTNKAGRAVRSRSKTGKGLQTIPIFILVPQVKLRRKLDLDRASDAWGERLPGLILDNWRDTDA